jgi:signal transduction histidine kinase
MVWPTSRSGSPDENPSSAIAAIRRERNTAVNPRFTRRGYPIGTTCVAGAMLPVMATSGRISRALLAIPTRYLVVAMVVSIAAIAYLADRAETQRSEDGLADLGEAEAAVAEVTARELSRDGAGHAPVAVDSPAHGGVRVLLLAPGEAAPLPGIGQAIASGERIVRIAREDAPVLGLSRRTAMAGIAKLADGRTVVVVASGERQRDRDRAGAARVLLSIALAAGLLTVFGALALVRQRAQLSLERDLAIADVARAKEQELERLSRAATMAALGSGVAHELSTPLGVIVGRAEQLLARAGDDDRLAKNARAILEQADHVDRVVRGLLGLARGAPIAMQDVDPARIARDAAALVAHRFERAHVELVLGDVGGAPTVRCEPLLLQHAIVNLLLNACDASPAGARVELDVERAGDQLAFVVADSGSGISPDHAARATEPFFTTKPVGKGTGLGLAIAREIAVAHRGALALAPRQPRGTRASIAIAVEPHDAERRGEGGDHDG